MTDHHAATTTRGHLLTDVAGAMEAAHEAWGDNWNLTDGTHTANKHVADEARTECDKAADNGTLTWRDILLEEVWEALAETQHARLRAELLQVAATALRWIEAIDNRTTP